MRSIFRIKVSDRVTRRILGYVGDLSEGGFQLLSDEAVAVGRHLAFRFKLRDRDGIMQSVEVDGVCKWSRENVRTGFFEAGFAVERAPPEYARLINGMRAKRGMTVSS